MLVCIEYIGFWSYHKIMMKLSAGSGSISRSTRQIRIKHKKYRNVICLTSLLANLKNEFEGFIIFCFIDQIKQFIFYQTGARSTEPSLIFRGNQMELGDMQSGPDTVLQNFNPFVGGRFSRPIIHIENGIKRFIYIHNTHSLPIIFIF